MSRRKKSPDTLAEAGETPLGPDRAPIVVDRPQADDYYKRLRAELKRWLRSSEGKRSKWADLLLFAPDMFHLVYRLATDAAVPFAHRARLAAALAYFMSPLDILPEVLLGPIGLLDDIALAAYVVHRLINDTNPAIVQRHWAGDTDLLDLIQRILKLTSAFLGPGIMGRLERVIRPRKKQPKG